MYTDPNQESQIPKDSKDPIRNAFLYKTSNQAIFWS